MDILKEARIAGLLVTVECSSLVVRGPRRFAALVARLQSRKAEVLDALDPSPADRSEEWRERAAIMEYDGGLPRARAEGFALEYVLRAMDEAIGPDEKSLGDGYR